MQYNYRLKQLREDSDMSQAALAEALGMYKTTYARYEKEQRDMPLQIAIQIADFYCISLDELAGRKVYSQK